MTTNYFKDLMFPTIKGLDFQDLGESKSSKIEDVVKEITLENPEEWTREDKDTLSQKIVDFILNNQPSTYDEVFNKKDFDKVKSPKDKVMLVPPIFYYLLADGAFDWRHYEKVMLDAPKDAEVIASFIPEDKFVTALWSFYRSWKEYSNTTVTSGSFKMPRLDNEIRTTIDAVLGSVKEAPKWGDIEGFIRSSGAIQTSLSRQLVDLRSASGSRIDGLEKELQERQEAIGRMSRELTVRSLTAEVKVKGDGTIPNGNCIIKKASDIFKELKGSDFDVPVWEWDGEHPDVPEIDPHYIFRKDLLVSALYAIVSNQRMYLRGHTGSGKTTLVEQVAAHLNWPFLRINFDSAITRMDLIGRDTLKDGKSVFIDGTLPRAMSNPYITCFDEIDFCRPDVAYVMQAALEGNGLNITEDGGRVVKPHPMSRMFGTGNTVGQGDEHGMYQGARPQSIAFLDRFTVWGKVDYLDSKQRTSLVERHFPGLAEEEVKTIIKYTDEHLSAFEQSKVLQPISPRGMLAVAKTLAFFNMVKADKENVKKALKMVVLDRATEADGAVLKELVDRVCK